MFHTRLLYLSSPLVFLFHSFLVNLNDRFCLNFIILIIGLVPPASELLDIPGNAVPEIMSPRYTLTLENLLEDYNNENLKALHENKKPTLANIVNHTANATII